MTDAVIMVDDVPSTEIVVTAKGLVRFATTAVLSLEVEVSDRLLADTHVANSVATEILVCDQ